MYTPGPEHAQDSRFDFSLNALTCGAEISGAQLGQHTAQLGTLEEWEVFWTFFEHFLLFLPSFFFFFPKKSFISQGEILSS